MHTIFVFLSLCQATWPTDIQKHNITCGDDMGIVISIYADDQWWNFECYEDILFHPIDAVNEMKKRINLIRPGDGNQIVGIMGKDGLVKM